jgi:hypothetical protein
MRPKVHVPLALVTVVSAALCAGCDVPACDAASGNLPSEQAVACGIPDDVELASAVTNAHAWYGEDGTLTITLDNVGLPCGASAADVQHADDCERDAFAYTLEIPPELVDADEIVLEEHAEVLGNGHASDATGAGWTGAELPGNQPFWAGRLRVSSREAACVSLVLDGVHSPILDAFSGSVLDGAVALPICEG